MSLYAESARTRKAVRLLEAARARAVSAEQVATDAVLRADLVADTGVRPPSALTWAVVVSLMQELPA